MDAKTKKKKTLIITFVSIAVSFQLLACLICLLLFILPFTFFPKDYYVYSVSSEQVVENDVEYTVSKIFNKARVCDIILTEDETTYEFAIPECLEKGARIDGFGFPTKGMEIFNFEIKDKKLDLYGYGPYVEENYIPKVSKNYYVTIIIGENIKKADCLLETQYLVYKIEDTQEYICINIEYQVSPNNKYYYSQDGKLYEK